MKVRVYTNTKTRVNENWNPYGLINSCPVTEQIKHKIIQGEANDHISSGKFALQNSFYKHIGIDIVTETVFDYPGAHFTEKTFRPIINKRPFIIVGAAHSLEFLHTKGIKTFSPFINEEYDNIENPIERMQAIFDEVSRLAKLPIDKIQDFVLEYTPVLDHNFSVLKCVEEQELDAIRKRLSNL